MSKGVIDDSTSVQIMYVTQLDGEHDILTPLRSIFWGLTINGDSRSAIKA